MYITLKPCLPPHTTSTRYCSSPCFSPRIPALYAHVYGCPSRLIIIQHVHSRRLPTVRVAVAFRRHAQPLLVFRPPDRGGVASRCIWGAGVTQTVSRSGKSEIALGNADIIVGDSVASCLRYHIIPRYDCCVLCEVRFSRGWLL